jgi:phage tail-like protein
VADPPEVLTNSRFYLELKLDGSSDAVDGYFMECSGFKATQEVIKIAEVTPQKWGQHGKATGRLVSTHIPGELNYEQVTLRRGLTCSMVFWNWLSAVNSGSWGKQRRDGSLVIYNQAAQAQFRFEFKRAWPVSYTIADMNVAQGELEIETVELTMEELKRVKTENAV